MIIKAVKKYSFLKVSSRKNNHTLILTGIAESIEKKTCETRQNYLYYTVSSF